jgi:hypothetical protein
MVTSSKNEVVFKRAILQFGTAGSAASTDVGYISNATAIEVQYEPETQDVRTDSLHLPLMTKITGGAYTIRGSFLQHNTDLLESVFGVTAVGNKLTLSGSAITTPEFSLRVTATREDAQTVVWDFPYCVSVSGPTFSYSRTDVAEVGFEFKAIEGASAAAAVTNGYTAAATLATGVLTRTASQGYHTITSETGGADTLDSITGTSLADGETLLLQITATAAPITLTHLDDTLELTGDVDWVMTSLSDWILLTYSATKTGWVESGRYDAV